MSLCPDGLLDMAFVLPEVMGKGTAAALYDILLAKARAENLPRLTVSASIFSHRFLARRGWQVDWSGLKPHAGLHYKSFEMSLNLDAEPPAG